MSIPNLITFVRIILIPIFMLMFYIPYRPAALITALLFAIGALTDWLDGYLARALSQTSRLGEFLDPVADKLVVAIALVLLVGEGQWVYTAIPAAIIVGREIVISALREWMAEIGKRASVAVSYVGKIKTALQMLAILLLLLGRPNAELHNQWINIIGFGLLYLAAMLTLWSMIMYLRAAWPQLKIENY